MRPQCVNDPATARTHEDVAEEHSKTIKCKRRLQEVSDRDERCEISVPLTLSKCAKNGSRSLVGQKKGSVMMTAPLKATSYAELWPSRTVCPICWAPYDIHEQSCSHVSRSCTKQYPSMSC